MQRYDPDSRIDRRNTRCSKWDRLPGAEYPMTVADMDLPAAPAITEAILKRAEHPIYGYPYAADEVEEVFTTWFKRKYGCSIQKEWVCTLPGIVPVIPLAVTLQEGDSLIYTPNYHVIQRAVERSGRNLIRVPMEMDARRRYIPDIKRLEKSITKDVRFLLLVNPQNPIGLMYTRKELEELASFAKDHRLTVISDEIHCELAFDREHVPFISVDGYARDHSISFYSPGKSCNISGSCLSFALIPDEKLRDAFKKSLCRFPHPGIFEIEMTIAAYRDCEDWKAELLKYLRANRDTLESFLKEYLPKAGFPHTEATYLQWLDLSAYFGESVAERIKESTGILLSEGAPFGEVDHVRMNFACPVRELLKALEKIRDSAGV